MPRLSKPPFPLLCPLLAAALCAGCDLRDRDMYYQPKHKPYDPSTFFQDGSSARPLVAGTVPRPEAAPDRLGQGAVGIGSLSATTGPTTMAESTAGVSGAAAGYAATGPGGFPTEFPTSGPELAAKLARGQQRFNIYCSVCHGLSGQGNGMIVQRGFSRPPAFYTLAEDEKNNPQLYARELYLQNGPDTPRHVYDVITNGYGAMYSYAERVKPDDRWAIAAYVRTLQAARPGATTPPPSGVIGPDKTRGTSP